MSEELSEKELHYLGGVFDSEGTFNIDVQPAEKMNIGYYSTPRFQIRMAVEKDESAIKDLILRFFDSLGLDADPHIIERPEDKDWRDVWYIGVGSSSAIKVMEEIKPYVKLKKKQIELILSVDWTKANRSKQAYLKAMKVRKELRSLQGVSESKYDLEYFKEEFDPEANSASEVDW